MNPECMSIPTFTAALTPRLFGCPYPISQRNWLNSAGAMMLLVLNTSPGTCRNA